MDSGEKHNEIVAWAINTFAAEKNKIIITTILLVVMGFMWLRVFSKKNEASAKIHTQAAQTQEAELEISYIALPMVQGRNDTLNRDFFSPEQFSSFLQNGKSGNVIVGQAGDKEIQQLASTIKLEAIVSGSTPEAFIDDKLLRQGDKLNVERKGKLFEFEIVKISQNKVQLKCNETMVTIEIVDNQITN